MAEIWGRDLKPPVDGLFYWVFGFGTFFRYHSFKIEIDAWETTVDRVSWLLATTHDLCQTHVCFSRFSFPSRDFMLSSAFFKITQAKHLSSAKNAESFQPKNCFFSTLYCEFQKSSFKMKIMTSWANRKGIHMHWISSRQPKLRYYWLKEYNRNFSRKSINCSFLNSSP